jgi:hypothetical protein
MEELRGLLMENFRSFDARGTTLRLRGFPSNRIFTGFDLPPVRQVAAGAAVELRRNVVVTSWARTPIVRFGFH